MVTYGVAACAPGLARWLQAWRRPGGGACAVVVALVPDARVRQLDRRYRRKECAQPTCCRSPPASPGFSASRDCSGVAGRQARQAGHPWQVELRVLALHGLLHLLGYDHEHDDGRMAGSSVACAGRVACAKG